MGKFSRQFEEFYRETSSNIFNFARALNFQPTWQQEKLLAAVQRAADGAGSNWIACKSGQGPGKTTCSAVIGLWWAYRAIDGLTVVTAPSMRQCKDIWMTEVRRHLEKAVPIIRHFIRVHKTKVEMCNRSDWGVKLVTASREENAQGYHQEHLAVVVEEASGVPREIITQFKGTLSNPNSLLLMIGNPNTRDCAFFDCFNSQRDRWTNLTFNAEETPESTWFSLQRNRDLENEFGRDSDIYRVRVLGEFPLSDPRCVISLDDVQAAGEKSKLFPCSKMVREDGTLARQFGMDFARFGGDESTLFRRTGNAIVQRMHFAHVEPARVVETAFDWQRSAGWSNQMAWYIADAGGMGQGIMHLFHDAGKQIIEFHNNGKAIQRDYANKITEAAFHLARLLRAGECYIPWDAVLAAQLSNRQYYTNKKGQLILESKDEYMRRGHDSPDRADGALLAFYEGVEATGRMAFPQNSELLGARVR